jgi:histidinol dehydrogenase
MDLFSQAEHDELAQAILLCPDADYIAQVEASIHKLLPTMPRFETITTSLSDRGALVKVRDMAEACAIANAIAAEHVEIMTADPEAVAAKIRNAGAIFIGPHTPEAIGDYVGGSNHVLPTARSARFSSGLGVLDFMKRTSILKCGPDQLRTLGPAAITLGKAEGLDAHARSVGLRLNLP